MKNEIIAYLLNYKINLLNYNLYQINQNKDMMV